MIIGNKIYHKKKCFNSLQWAKEEIEYAPDGSVFLADEHEYTKGRQSRIWKHYPGQLLVTILLKPKHIIKHLGKDSGKKGIIYALLGGIISHGPMYAWYGLLNDLRQNGAKEELLIIFLYARAIKIPMIPFSIAVFGTPFTIAISIYILLFAILQGKLFSYIDNKFY